MARDDFAGQTGGGGIRDFEFTVTDAWFGISEAFTEATGIDQLFMHWVGETDLDNEEHKFLTESGFHPSWKLGPDWEVTNQGKGVRYDGPSKKPRLGKAYGRLCDATLTLTEEVANTDQDPFAGDAVPTDANIWIGTKWYMEEIEQEWGKDMNKSRDLMPTKYLGKGSVSAPAAAPATAADNGAGSGDLRATVEALAKSANTYAEFQTAALAIPGVTADTALVIEIADESKLYTSVRS